MIKRSLIFILILLTILVIPIISAVEFNMKTNYSQGETLMAKLSGNFINPIIKENIFLYREHVRVPFEPYVEEISEEFYVYGQLLGKGQGNYSLSVENVKYMKAGEISEEKLIKNFTINDKIADFSIEPGFIVSDKDFFVEVQNLQDYEIVINIKIINVSALSAPSEEQEESNETKGFFASLFGGGKSEEQESPTSISTRTVNVKSGEIKKINFEIKEFSDLNLTFSFIELSTENLKYEIPAYVIFEETEEEKEKNIVFRPSELNVSLATSSNTTRIIYLFNNGQVLENISLSLSNSLIPYVSISPKEIEDLEENSSIAVKIQINSSSEEKNLEGQITAKTSDENIFANVDLSVNIIKDFVPSEEPGIFPTCSEIDGEICSKGETCEGKTENAKDGICCLGTCKKKEKSPVGRIIALIVVVGVVALLIWFYKKKYKGAKRSVDLLKVAEGKK